MYMSTHPPNIEALDTAPSDVLDPPMQTYMVKRHEIVLGPEALSSRDVLYTLCQGALQSLRGTLALRVARERYVFFETLEPKV